MPDIGLFLRLLTLLASNLLHRIKFTALVFLNLTQLFNQIE